MKVMYRFNRFIEKWMPLVTPCSVILGILFASWLAPLVYLVPWIFAFMTFSGGLGSSFTDLKKVMLHPAPLIICLVLLHVWMPIMAWGIGHLVFGQDMFTLTGLILAFVIPTGIISFMWVSIYQGNIALTLSIILLDTFLSPFIVPSVLHVLLGADVKIDTWGMMSGLLWMVVLPSLVAMALNQWTRGRIKPLLAPKLAPFSKLGLIAVVMINTAAAAPFFKKVDGHFIAVACTVFGIAASGYMWGWLAAKLLRGNRGVVVAMTFNSGMRNISAGAVLAATYFPAPVLFPVMVGTLFQQLLASTYAYLLSKRYGKTEEAPLPSTLAGGRTAVG